MTLKYHFNLGLYLVDYLFERSIFPTINSDDHTKQYESEEATCLIEKAESRGGTLRLAKLRVIRLL